METVEQVIANIRSRDIELSIKDGDRIVTSRPLQPAEEETLKENRAAAVAIINATARETPEQACGRGYAAGYAKGIEHATEEFQTRPPVAAPVAQVLPPTTPDGEIEKFKTWQGQKSEYYKWEIECLEALRAALAPGDKIHPLFAFSCVIIGANGVEREFKRKPGKKK
jgi:hypothetical protein